MWLRYRKNVVINTPKKAEVSKDACILIGKLSVPQKEAYTITDSATSSGIALPMYMYTMYLGLVVKTKLVNFNDFFFF